MEENQSWFRGPASSHSGGGDKHIPFRSKLGKHKEALKPKYEKVESGWASWGREHSGR